MQVQIRPKSRLFRAAGLLCLALVCFLQTLWASTDFVVPPGPGDYPRGIVTGPDGNLWAANSNSRSIGRIDPTTGVLTRFPVANAIYLWDITNGPDGNLWFTDNAADLIGRISTAGQIATFQLTAGAHPVAITAGPDGALWFTEFAAGKIGRITVGGAISEFSAGKRSCCSWRTS